MHPQDTIVNLNVNNKNAKNQDSDKNILSPEVHEVVSAIKQKEESDLTVGFKKSQRAREKDYDDIKRKFLQLTGKEMSDLAFRIICYLMSKPDDWHVRICHFRSHFDVGKEKLQSAMRELQEKGYIRRYKEKREDGTFFRWSTEYSDIPEFLEENNESTESRKNRPSEKPTAGKTGHIQSKEINTNLRNNNKENGKLETPLKSESNVVVSFEKRDDEKEDDLLKKELVEIGLSNFDAARMVAKHGSYKIREKLKMMPPESKIKSSRAAWLRSAIERDYPPPENVPTAKILSQEDTERRLKAQADAAEVEHAKFMIDCALAQNNPGAAQVWKDFLSARP